MDVSFEPKFLVLSMPMLQRSVYSKTESQKVSSLPFPLLSTYFPLAFSYWLFHILNNWKNIRQHSLSLGWTAGLWSRLWDKVIYIVSSSIRFLFESSLWVHYLNLGSIHSAVCSTVGVSRMVVSNSWGISGLPESIANASSGNEEPTAYASYLADLAGDIDRADMTSGIGIDLVRNGTAPRRNSSWPSKEGKSK